jgi:hypothetical protein
VVPPSNLQVARAGQFLVAAELSLLGAADVSFVEERRRKELHATSADGRTIEIKVKTKRSGDWQPSLREAEPQPAATENERFWIFVDLSKPEARPGFFVVPEPWMQRDIREVHQAYLARHGGHRALTPASKHHAVREDRIAEWKDRWDLLGV